MKMPSSLRGHGAKVMGIVLLVVILGWWFRVLLPVAICLGVVALFLVAWFTVGYLALTGRIKPVHDLPDRNTLSEACYPAEWNALEGQLISVLKAGPDDSYRAVMLRFALATNVVDQDQTTLPPGVSGVIMRKMLYEYQRRTGSLYFERFDERTAMSGPEVLRKLSDEERPRFLEFCRSLDDPANATPVTVKPGYLSTAELVRR